MTLPDRGALPGSGLPFLLFSEDGALCDERGVLTKMPELFKIKIQGLAVCGDIMVLQPSDDLRHRQAVFIICLLGQNPCKLQKL